MRTIDATKLLIMEDHKERHVYTKTELGELFGVEDRELTDVLGRLVQEKILDHVFRGIYVYKLSAHWGFSTGQQVAMLIRPGEAIYESGLSAAAMWGMVLHTPLSLTLVTSGKPGKYRTKYGPIEFFHSETARDDLENNTVDRSQFGELSLANKRLTYEDVRRFGDCPELLQEKFCEDMVGIDGAINRSDLQNDDVWGFLDPEDDIEDIEFLSQRPQRWNAAFRH